MNFNNNELQNEESNDTELNENKIDDNDLDVSGGKVVIGKDGKYYPIIDAIGGFSNKKTAIEVDKLINDAMPKPGASPMKRPAFKINPRNQKRRRTK